MGVFRGNTQRILLLAGVLMATALLAPGVAGAASVVNGGFETGSLKGWSVFRATEAGDWFAYKGTEAPIGGRRGAEPVQPPPVGDYAAIADQANPEMGVLYQDIALEPGRAHRLDLLAYYNSYEPLAIPTPDSLSVDQEVLAGQSNQQFRIDVISPAAPLDTIAAGEVLGTLFRTEVGGPQEMQPTGFSLNLTAFAGQTVRLRIANAVSEEVFNAGVDAVEVVSGPPGQLPAPKFPGTKKDADGKKPDGKNPDAAKGFSLGKVKGNKNNGTATLAVQVPGPGRVSAKDGGGKASASGRKGKPKRPPMIRSTSVKATAEGAVKLTLRPTPAAREILALRHRLRVTVAVSFQPANGAAETATVPVVLKLEARHHRR
jgi:hypothetical protein